MLISKAYACAYSQCALVLEVLVQEGPLQMKGACIRRAPSNK